MVQTLPVDDLDRLLDCIAEIAVRRPDRFHVRMESIHPAAPACVARALELRADRLPPTWSKALRDGWPPALEGLHRIELIPGRGLVSIACRLPSTLIRRMPPGFRAAPYRVAGARADGSEGPERPEGLERPVTTADATADAIVVGAGLAGCALADALTRRGWRVTVLEASGNVGGAVGALPLLAQHPAVSPGRDRRSRLLLRALLVSDRLRDRLGPAFERCGRFQPMAFAEAQRRCAGLPATVARPLRFGTLAGLWFQRCAIADPGRWWAQVLARPGATLRLGSPVLAVMKVGGRWHAQGAGGDRLAAAPIVVLANQADAFRLAGMTPAATGRLRRSGLQVLVGRPDPCPAVGTGPPAGSPSAAIRRRARPIVGGAGFRIEKPGVACVIGPGADRVDATPAPPGAAGWRWQRSVAAERLQLRDNLPMIGAVPDLEALSADQDRYARNDRLALPRRDGLQILAGLGGRGLLWSVLGAEVIAAELNGEPVHLEPDLAAAVDPARFLKRTLQRIRRGRGV